VDYRLLLPQPDAEVAKVAAILAQQQRQYEADIHCGRGVVAGLVAEAEGSSLVDDDVVGLLP